MSEVRTFIVNLIAVLGLLVGVADAAWNLFDHLHIERVEEHLRHADKMHNDLVAAQPTSEKPKEETK